MGYTCARPSALFLARAGPVLGTILDERDGDKDQVYVRILERAVDIRPALLINISSAPINNPVLTYIPR